MKILGIESASNVASAALVENGQLVAVYSVNHKKTHSQTLLPMIDEVLRMTETKKSEIDGIAVSSGPGSFTGLRIGCATAKGLALGLDRPILPVPTLSAMAYELWGSDALVIPMLDARRGQVFAGAFCVLGEEPEAVIPAGAYALNELMEKAMAVLSDEGNPFAKILVLGDGAAVGETTIRAIGGEAVSFVPAHKNRESAASVAALGEKMLADGRGIPGESFAPEYFRISQAERVRAEKEQV